MKSGVGGQDQRKRYGWPEYSWLYKGCAPNETAALTAISLAKTKLKRIMSLPDDFKLTGKWNQKAERIGRMVPPLMMKAIATSVYEKVLEKYNG